MNRLLFSIYTNHIIVHQLYHFFSIGCSRWKLKSSPKYACMLAISFSNWAKLVWYSRMICFMRLKCGLFSSVSNSNSPHSISILHRSINSQLNSCTTSDKIVESRVVHAHEESIFLLVAIDWLSKTTFLPSAVMGLPITSQSRLFLSKLYPAIFAASGSHSTAMTSGSDHRYWRNNHKSPIVAHKSKTTGCLDNLPAAKRWLMYQYSSRANVAVNTTVSPPLFLVVAYNFCFVIGLRSVYVYVLWLFDHAHKQATVSCCIAWTVPCIVHFSKIHTIRQTFVLRRSYIRWLPTGTWFTVGGYDCNLDFIGIE